MRQVYDLISIHPGRPQCLNSPQIRTDLIGFVRSERFRNILAKGVSIQFWASQLVRSRVRNTPPPSKHASDNFGERSGEKYRQGREGDGVFFPWLYSNIAGISVLTRSEQLENIMYKCILYDSSDSLFAQGSEHILPSPRDHHSPLGLPFRNQKQLGAWVVVAFDTKLNFVYSMKWY